MSQVVVEPAAQHVHLASSILTARPNTHRPAVYFSFSGEAIEAWGAPEKESRCVGFRQASPHALLCEMLHLMGRFAHAEPQSLPPPVVLCQPRLFIQQDTQGHWAIPEASLRSTCLVHCIPLGTLWPGPILPTPCCGSPVSFCCLLLLYSAAVTQSPWAMMSLRTEIKSQGQGKV